jgi:hypothetical protein
MDDAGAHYHPGQSATLRMGPKNILAAFGTLHPATAKAFDLDGNVVAAEIFLDAIALKKASGFMRPAFTPPALQAVTRDFALVVPTQIPAQDLVRAVRASDREKIKAARIFDRFIGQDIQEGYASLAFEVELQPIDKSFDELMIKEVIENAIHSVLSVVSSFQHPCIFRGEASVLSDGSLKMLHEGILTALAEDDALAEQPKKFGVRDYPDWRRQADALERELEMRGLDFGTIRW